MKRSKETFMDQREQEAQIREEEEMEGYYYPHPKGYHSKRKPVKTFREKLIDPIAEHNEQEYKIVDEQNKHFEQDNPRE